MLFKITSVVSKNDSWKLVSGTGLDGVAITDASANRVDKNSKTWDKFDEIVEGGQIEADLWKNPSGKQYLFAPKIKSSTEAPRSSGGAYKAKQIEEAQERTHTHVQEAQNNKNEAIVLAAAQRDAVLMVITFDKETPFPTDAELQERFKFWREFFLSEATKRGSLPF